MIGNKLKQYMPMGIYGRAALILLVPIVTILVFASVVFVQRHYEDVTRQMTRNMALEIRLILDRINAADDLGAGLSEATALADPLQITVEPALVVPTSDYRVWYDFAGPAFFDALRAEVPGVLAIVKGRVPGQVQFWVKSEAGDVVVGFSQTRVGAANPHQFLVLTLFVAVIMVWIAFIFLRNQMRPISRLAAASEAFGRGQVMPYQPAGATEVRSAGIAFVEMRERIERQIEQRTLMLSGVSHDLRTPLTRMKLALSMMPEDGDISALSRDVEDMERLLDVFLDFARGEAAEEVEVVSAHAVLAALSDRYAKNPKVTFAVTPDLPMVALRPMSAERALGNLIENALRYGTQAAVSAETDGAMIVLVVEDDGPGIAPDDRQNAIKPFNRLDVARNQDKGVGVGLGLAIANDMCRRHGGELRLSTSEKLGGLRAEVVLPVVGWTV